MRSMAYWSDGAATATCRRSTPRSTSRASIRDAASGRPIRSTSSGSTKSRRSTSTAKRSRGWLDVGHGVLHVHAAAGNVGGLPQVPVGTFARPQPRHHDDRRRAALLSGAARENYRRLSRARTRGARKGNTRTRSGRIFPISEEDISIPARIFPREFARIRGLDFGWDHPFACVELVHDRDEDVLYVVKCHKQRQSTPIIHAATIRAWGNEWVPIAWPHDGLVSDKGSGMELATQYRNQHLNMLPERATFLDGGSGVEAGLMEMLGRMQTGRLKVFAHCTEWFEEFRLYHRKEGKVVKNLTT